MFGRLILETYVQDRCRDVRFKDEHLTWFEIKKKDWNGHKKLAQKEAREKWNERV